MRIGIFGGTFDPVHLGHLILAEQCREQAKLDEVRFLPSARPPHKDTAEVTPFDKRAEMLRLAMAGHPAFAVDEIENERDAPSYTADTLDLLAERHPGAELLLIVGADCLPDLPGWYEPRRIVSRAELLAVGRPGLAVWDSERLAEELGMDADAVRLTVVDSPAIGISSTDLRDRVGRGRSVRYQVPRAVEEYIRDKRLYLGEMSAG